MAKHLVKCFYCSQQFDANIEPFVKINSKRYAHKDCALNAENNKSKEEKDKEALEKYIKELFGISSITPKIKKQIEIYKEKNNYSYSGMHKTLKYFFEIRGNSIEKANGGIGIIPYAWDQAFTYYRALWEAKERNKKVKIEQCVLPIQEIHIEPPDRQPMKQMRKLFCFLDEEEKELNEK